MHQQTVYMHIFLDIAGVVLYFVASLDLFKEIHHFFTLFSPQTVKKGGQLLHFLEKKTKKERKKE